jgi:hypothetical protein
MTQQEASDMVTLGAITAELHALAGEIGGGQGRDRVMWAAQRASSVMPRLTEMLGRLSQPKVPIEAKAESKRIKEALRKQERRKGAA